jgi:hypothetical protein
MAFSVGCSCVMDDWGGASAVDKQRPTAQRADRGYAKAKFAGHQTPAVVEIDVGIDKDRLHSETMSRNRRGIPELKVGLCG